MGVSPFMAFAKGAFEGYNQIQDEQRATDALIAAERAKTANKDTIASNFFTTYSETGPIQWFQHSDAKEEKTRNARDLGMIAQLATPAIMGQMTAEQYNQWQDKTVGIMQRYHDSIKVYSEDKQLVYTPGDHTFPELLRNPFTRDLWKNVLKGSYVFDQKGVPGTGIHVSQDSDGGINAKKVNVDYSLYGMTEKQWDTAARTFAIERGDDPETAAIKYSEEFKHTIFLHSVMNPENPNEPMREVWKRVVNTAVVNPADIRAINILQDSINQNDTIQMGSYDVFKALEFVAPKQIDIKVPRSNDIVTHHDPTAYLKNVLDLDPEQLNEKRSAAKLGQRISHKIYTEIVAYEGRYGEAPPATSATSGVANFFAAFTGKTGTVLEQLGFLGGATLAKFGVKDDGAVGYIAEQHKIYEKALTDAETLGDEKLIAAAKTGAVVQLYSVMLAYQLAVAIQGGTGGRTVSDMDVRNMQKAFGDRIFVNNRIQKHVLLEVNSFLQDIIGATGYFTEALGATDLRPMKAAAAHHKLFFGGLKAGEEIDMEYMGERLTDRVSSATISQEGGTYYGGSGEGIIYRIVSSGGKKLDVDNQSTALGIYNELKNSPTVQDMNSDELARFGLQGLKDTDFTTEEDAQFYLESIRNGFLIKEGSK